MRNWFSDMSFSKSSFFIFIILLATTLTLSKCETMDDPDILAFPRSNKELDFKYIINIPLRRCPKHQKRDHLGKCRDIFILQKTEDRRKKIVDGVTFRDQRESKIDKFS